MQKNYLIVCFSLIFIPCVLYGQEDKSQELNTLLNEGKYFESKKLYQEISNVISPDMDLFYKFQMAQFMNKNDSAAIYIEKMLIDYPDMFGNNTIFVYARLFDIYAVSLRNYEKSVCTYKRMIQHLKDNPYNLDEKELALWKDGNKTRVDYLKQLMSQPPIKMKRGSTNSSVYFKSDKKQLVIDVKTNGMSQKTLVDTGCNYYYIMNREKAEELGLECAVSEMSKGVINNTEMLIKQVIVDSIEIGNITLYNIPATIFEYDITQYLPDSVKQQQESFAQIEPLYTNITNPIIGLPIMKLIGKFLIDYEEQAVSFPSITFRLDSLIDSNMFLYNAYLYTQLKLNKKDFTGTLDIGFDEYMMIDSLFYERYQNDIPTVSMAEKDSYNIVMVHQFYNNIPYKIAHNLSIEFNNKLMFPPLEKDIKIYSMQPVFLPMKIFDGIIGYDFFRRLGKKVLLDFDNMRLEVEE